MQCDDGSGEWFWGWFWGFLLVVIRPDSAGTAQVGDKVRAGNGDGAVNRIVPKDGV
jgi:hypothetical protein